MKRWRARVYARYARRCQWIAGMSLSYIEDYGRTRAQIERLEADAEHWLELAYYWRERLREYLTGVEW